MCLIFRDRTVNSIHARATHSRLVLLGPPGLFLLSVAVASVLLVPFGVFTVLLLVVGNTMGDEVLVEALGNNSDETGKVTQL